MTNDVRKVLSAEWFKVRGRKTTFIVPALTILCSVVLFFAVGYAAGKDWIGLSSGFYIASVSMGWLVNAMAFVAVVMTGFQISGEFAMGTVKPAWTRPVSRRSWYLGKLIACSAGVTFLFLISLVTIVVLAGLKFGYSDLMEKDYLVHSSGEMWRSLLIASALAIWSLWSAVAATSVFAAFFNRPGGAIATVVAVSFAMTLLAIIPSARPLLLSTCLTQPFEQMTAMSKGLPLPMEWGTLMWRTAACAGIWTLVSALAGSAAVAKKEITF